MNDFPPTPSVLSAHSFQLQPSLRRPLGAIAVLSMIFDKVANANVETVTHSWHDLLFLLLVSSFSVDLIVELIHSTAAALHMAGKRLEPIWPALSELAAALRALCLAFLPPSWRRRSTTS